MIAMFFPAPNLLTAAHVYDISYISFSSGTDFNPSALSSTPPRTKPSLNLFNINLVPRVLRLLGQWVVARRDSGMLVFLWQQSCGYCFLVLLYIVKSQ